MEPLITSVREDGRALPIADRLKAARAVVIAYRRVIIPRRIA
jgi:hypothetical protein